MESFLEHFEPIRIHNLLTGEPATVAYVKAGTARWVIAGPQHRLRKWPALAKDCTVIEALAHADVQQLEVLDKTENMVYSISMATFTEHRWLLVTRAGEQWAVDKRWWSCRTYR